MVEGDSRNTWETPAEGGLSQEMEDQAGERISDIVEFLTKWEDLDRDLYPKKGVTRVPLVNGLKGIAREAMQVYYWYHWLGEEAMDYHHQDKSW